MRRAKDGESPFETNPQAAKDLILRRHKAEKVILEVIERLVEPTINERVLLESAHILRPSDYSEAVLERNCVHLCGYPICAETIPDVGAAKQFDHKRLVMRDTSNDQRFCSLSHRKASKFFEMQLIDTPLWYRDVASGSGTVEHVELLDESNVEGSLRAWLNRTEAAPTKDSRKARIDAGPMTIVEKCTRLDLDDDKERSISGDHRSIEGFTTNQSHSKKRLTS